jgi:hypothetical protein
MKEEITIIIPSLNQIGDLIKTIDFINTQYKSSVCKVIVADCGSRDGSTQYINQKSWEDRGINIDIVYVPNNKRIEEYVNIDTSYFMVIFPGYRSYSRDFILDHFNLITRKKDNPIIINTIPLIHSFTEWFNSLFRKTKRISTDFLFTTKENLPRILSIGSREIVVNCGGVRLIPAKKGIITY